jgi:hypothetical protein
MPRQLRTAAEFLDTLRGAWIALGVAMVLSATLILLTADGESFGIDEMFYLGRLVEDSGQIVEFRSLSLEYLLGPYNGHLQLGGKVEHHAHYTVDGKTYEMR